jgi:GNAT superfamily N-acetyltransferase
VNDGAIDLRRIEEQSLNVTQPTRQLFYDGWLLRMMPGRTKRARSVNAFYSSSLAVDDKIRHCERVYADAGLPAMFRITPFDSPHDLDAMLDTRGYARYDDTQVMLAPLRRPPAVDARDDVDTRAPGLAAYCAAVAVIRGSNTQQRAAHQARLANASVSHHCVVAMCEGNPVATGQLAYEGDVAGLFDVVTAEDARGRGYATALCVHLLNWAWSHGMRCVYLQVTADNAPALAVYRKFGFAPCYAYHYRCRPEEFA